MWFSGKQEWAVSLQAEASRVRTQLACSLSLHVTSVKLEIKGNVEASHSRLVINTAVSERNRLWLAFGVRDGLSLLYNVVYPD